MSLSRRAKRGISVLSKLQWSLKNARYHLSPKNTISLVPSADPKLVTAATEAMEILVRNGEAAHVNSEVIPEGENDALTPNAQERTELRVPLQPEDSQKGPEGGPIGAVGDGQ